jgi:hypothetical protein
MPAEKRSYGAGSLYFHTDAAGREMYYGRWRRDGQHVIETMRGREWEL